MQRVDREAGALNAVRTSVLRCAEAAWIVAAFLWMLILVTLSRAVGLYAYRMRHGHAENDIFESYPFHM